MISFNLCCDDGHEFEGWFRNGQAFDEQAEAGVLECPYCGSNTVTKGLMAPAVPAKSNKRDDAPAQVAATPDPAARELVDQIRKLRTHLRENSEYVGEKFTEEARRIHYDDGEKRGIYGEASVEDARELREEGIDVLPLPVLPEDQN